MMSKAYNLGSHLLMARQGFAQSVRFARRRGGFDPDKLRGRRGPAEVEDAYSVDDVADQLTEMEDLMAELEGNDAPLRRMSHAEVMQERQRLKSRILEKKHFKEEQEVNLLTWSAKAQIRHLNQQSPQEWTPERLAQSFPVSRDGVIRLLKSSWAPRSEEERVKHDSRVYRHWKELTKAGASPSGPMHPLLQQLLESQRLGLMKNASGIATLPAPQQTLPAVSKTRARGGPAPPSVGPFSSILLEVQPKMKTPPLQSSPSSSQVRILGEAEALLKKFHLLGLQQDVSGKRDSSQDVSVQSRGRRGTRGVPRRQEMDSVSAQGEMSDYFVRNEGPAASVRREVSEEEIWQQQQQQWRIQQSERRMRTEDEVPPRSSHRRRRMPIRSQGNVESEGFTSDALLRLQMQGTYKIPHDKKRKASDGED